MDRRKQSAVGVNGCAGSLLTKQAALRHLRRLCSACRSPGAPPRNPALRGRLCGGHSCAEGGKVIVPHSPCDPCSRGSVVLHSSPEPPPARRGRSPRPCTPRRLPTGWGALRIPRTHCDWWKVARQGSTLIHPQRTSRDALRMDEEEQQQIEFQDRPLADICHALKHRSVASPNRPLARRNT